LALLGQENDIFDEDCLKLNVWSKPQTGDTKKAVLFWVHGGGYSIGASDMPVYNGQYIADQEDVIVVSTKSVCFPCFDEPE
jgi:carboxylesterase type B